MLVTPGELLIFRDVLFRGCCVELLVVGFSPGSSIEAGMVQSVRSGNRCFLERCWGCSSGRILLVLLWSRRGALCSSL